MLTYDYLLYEFAKNPRDLHTVPQNNVTPKWFHVYSDGDIIRCSSNVEEGHRPASEFTVDRKLFRSQFDGMIDCYKAGKRGESRSQYAKENKIDSFCNSYWMAILHEYRNQI